MNNDRVNMFRDEFKGISPYFKLYLVKGRPFGSPLARGMEPRASTASSATGLPVALDAVESFVRENYFAFAAEFLTSSSAILLYFSGFFLKSFKHILQQKL